MSNYKPIAVLSKKEQLNFLFTNRLPRRWLTLLMGWYSKIKSPFLTKVSIWIWSLFADDLKLQDAKKQTFESLHECFTRELKDGVRPIDNAHNVVVSPCDAIVGECGKVQDGQVFQAKGFPYQISELIPNIHIYRKYQNGTFITLRLKSSMYHRFHAPLACKVNRVTYISGDTWNVNPIALKKIEKLFCKNERAVVDLVVDAPNKHITLVPVAAILVASMKFHCLPNALNLKYKGPNQLCCLARYKKGEEMGYFEHGSTIIVFASANYALSDGIEKGKAIKMGQALLIDTSEEQVA